jgi:hypothetical protein
LLCPFNGYGYAITSLSETFNNTETKLDKIDYDGGTPVMPKLAVIEQLRSFKRADEI